jgi:hypothetical protein
VTVASPRMHLAGRLTLPSKIGYPTTTLAASHCKSHELDSDCLDRQQRSGEGDMSLDLLPGVTRFRNCGGTR